MTLTEWLRENTRTVAALVLGYVGYVEMTAAEYPTVPSGSGTAVVGAVAVAIAGYAAAGKINGLLPEEEGVYLVAFTADDEAGGEVWELTEDQFEDMTVHAGTLFQWPTGKRIYECREYRPEENVAVANWRESVAASELAGDVQVTDALDAIGELRDEFEPEARKFRQTKRRLRSVARRLDRRRDRDQQAVLDPHLSPEFGNESASVGDILHEEMPEHLLPDSMTAEEQTDAPNEPEGDFAGFELLDDAGGLDAPEPEMMNDD
jgi:hypothetical protein